MTLFVLIMLFAVIVIIAVFVYLFYLYKSRLFADLDYICDYLKNNIAFNKNNLNSLFTSCFESISPTSKYVLKNNTNYLSKLMLKGNLGLINDFYKSLGKGDVSFEISNLNYYAKIFGDLKDKSKEEIKTKGMLYFKLIIGAGLILCILLI